MTRAQELNISKFPYEEYDNKGRIIYFEEKENYWYKCKYDKECRQIYYENSDGYWWTIDFKKNGDSFYEDSNGYWEKKAYDKYDNHIYLANANGNWWKCEYEEKPNWVEKEIAQIIEYQDSDGNYWNKDMNIENPYSTNVIFD
jgi:hypothetical protein